MGSTQSTAHPPGATRPAIDDFMKPRRAVSKSPVPPPTGPGANPTLEQLKQWAEYQIDSMGNVPSPMLKRFILNWKDRRSGDRAIVQAAYSIADEGQYAVKFFLDRGQFDAEMSMYSDPVLGKLFPRLEEVCDNSEGIVRDASGHPLPPFIVMERGWNLMEWFQDVTTREQRLQVILQIAQTLESMHGAGYAHRNVKPSNILWMPVEEQWALVDFSSAAKIGDQAEVEVSEVAYAAPEVVAAWEERRESVAVAAAHDAWAVGVILCELLTGRRVFDMDFLDEPTVLAQIRGDQKAMWEDPGDAVNQNRLGEFQPLVSSLLQRDPSRRISMTDCISKIKASTGAA